MPDPTSSHASTILVTGSTDGIGKETARRLVAAGHRVILHGRSPARLAMTQAELARAAPPEGPAPETLCGDLASLASVRAMAADALARFPRVDVLLHNAGVYMNEPVLTVDGFEQTFAVNHLAPFLLTHLLLPAVTSRIILVSSIAHGRGRLDPASWRSLSRFDPYGAYAQSKLANVLFAVELARRLPPGVVSHSLHPGVVSTKLLVDGFGMNGSDSLTDGSTTSVWLATAPEVSNSTGRYFVKQREARMHPLASDPEATAAFYAESARMVGVSELARS